MNIMRLKEATQGYVVYFYLPESQGEPGEVRMNIGDEKAFVLTRASNDNSAEHYGYKAARAVTECIESNNIPLKFTNAWG